MKKISETYHPKPETLREIKKFGIIAVLFFGSLFALGLWRGKVIPVFIFGPLSLLGMGFIIAPSTLRPVYTGWLKVAHFIGGAITAIMLTLAYYLVITPTALIKRLVSGRPLPIKPDKEASSYWVTRSELAQPKERFIKRY
ncbi:MAG: hypothetical protein JRJ02_16160 [Deltaproteobacteria bacterium]|nr:hypothetical protein [Deltaproteobacteria bacterium]